jgi:hypothetical protein
MKKICESFSLLTDDDKTLNDLLLYIDNIGSEKDFTYLDNFIQKRELEWHCGLLHKQHNLEEETKWIVENADKIRQYINTIKQIALMLYIEKIQVNKENLKEIIENWNKKKDKVLDSLHL